MSEAEAERDQAFNACLNSGKDAKTCDDAVGVRYTSVLSFSYSNQPVFINSYEEEWQAFLSRRADKPFLRNWLAGDTVSGYAQAICQARKLEAQPGSSGVVVGRSQRSYAHVQGEYSEIEAGPDNLDYNYLYKFTFAVNPAECNMEFEVYVDSGREYHLFKNGDRPFRFRVYSDAPNEEDAKPNEFGGILAWGPGKGSPKLPEWQIIPGKNKHPKVCIEFSEAECLPTKKICNTIVESDYPYTGSLKGNWDPHDGDWGGHSNDNDGDDDDPYDNSDDDDDDGKPQLGDF